jgi:peptidoglycan-associated lipoprotein
MVGIYRAANAAGVAGATTCGYADATSSRDMSTMNFRIAAIAAVGLLAACSSYSPGAGSAGGAGGSGSGNGGVSSAPLGGVGAHGLETPGSEEDLAANVGDRVLFDFNRSDLTDTARAILDKQAAWLAQYPQDHVQIAGDTDERGTEEYNFVLGQRRANAARDYLVAKSIPSARIATVSYGKDRPVAMDSNEAAWAQNRNAITSVQ